MIDRAPPPSPPSGGSAPVPPPALHGPPDHAASYAGLPGRVDCEAESAQNRRTVRAHWRRLAHWQVVAHPGAAGRVCVGVGSGCACVPACSGATGVGVWVCVCVHACVHACVDACVRQYVHARIVHAHAGQNDGGVPGQIITRNRSAQGLRCVCHSHSSNRITQQFPYAHGYLIHAVS